LGLGVGFRLLVLVSGLDMGFRFCFCLHV